MTLQKSSNPGPDTEASSSEPAPSTAGDGALYRLIGRWTLDSKFAGQLTRDFEGTLAANGYYFSPSELANAKALFYAEPKTPDPRPYPTAPPAAGGPENLSFTPEQMGQLREAQVTRMIKMSQFALELQMNTLGNAAATYRLITRMNNIMFWMGVTLFLFAAAYGAVSKDLQITATFAGLGAASFVGIFFLGPIEKTQTALSNLIQAEVAFINYFEQVSFLENMAQMPSPQTGLPCAENVAKASALLQTRSEQTIELLQRYLEEPVRKSKDGRETPD